jgi:hypothetical protein
MTKEQLEVIKTFHEINLKNCDEFASFDYCQFNTLRNESNTDDKNIVIIATKIKELDNNFIPVTETKNFFVEPNGNFYEMDMMKDIFRNNNEVLSYIQTLTNFDWNEK